MGESVVCEVIDEAKVWERVEFGEIMEEASVWERV